MLLNYLCNARQGRMQRGGGVGNMHASRYNAIIPLEAFMDMQTGRGGSCPKPQVIQEVTPTQQAVEIAQSELEQAGTEQGSHKTKRARSKKKTQSKTKSRGGRSSRNPSNKTKRKRESTPPLFKKSTKKRK